MEAKMNEEMLKQMMAAAERLATAAESLDRVLDKLDAQQEALNAKVDRIVAAVEDNMAHGKGQRILGRRSRALRKTGAAGSGVGEVECGFESTGFAAGAEDAVSGGGGADRKRGNRGREAGPGIAE